MGAELMKAARFHELNRPLRIEDIAIPEIGDDEVLVRVKAVGLCGTDIHITREGLTVPAFMPITPGHEPAGVVARLASTAASARNVCRGAAHCASGDV
jgi:propanol-preferring alcohol dehydrogenase